MQFSSLTWLNNRQASMTHIIHWSAFYRGGCVGYHGNKHEKHHVSFHWRLSQVTKRNWDCWSWLNKSIKKQCLSLLSTRRSNLNQVYRGEVRWSNRSVPLKCVTAIWLMETLSSLYDNQLTWSCWARWPRWKLTVTLWYRRTLLLAGRHRTIDSKVSKLTQSIQYK